MNITFKKCAKCEVEKPLDSYTKHNRLGYQPRCKPCRSEDQKIYYRNNIEKFNGYKARARNETLEERQDRIQKRKLEAPVKREHAKWKAHIRKTLGIEPQDYEKLFSEQNGKCAVCGTDNPGGNRKRFCVDHCHTTGKIRGLLCVSCNSGLGYFKDNMELLSNAATYLKRYPVS
jgi:hypothetical protein